MHPTNESAVSFRWLTESLGASDTSSACSRSWRQVRGEMRAVSQSFFSSQDWISDFWLCKTAGVSLTGLGVQPTWDPPDELAEWPSLPSGFLQTYAPHDMRTTNHAQFLRVLSAATDVVESSSDAAVSEFYALDQATTRGGGLA